MLRTWIGVGVGCSAGVAIGYAASLQFNAPFDLWSSAHVILSGGFGAVVGAVVGGVSDVLAYLRRTLGDRPKQGPETDYSELPKNPTPDTR